MGYDGAGMADILLFSFVIFDSLAEIESTVYVALLKCSKQKTGASFSAIYFIPTNREYKKMAWQNTFQILLLNDANIIGEH
jgi:hypothetical protein